MFRTIGGKHMHQQTSGSKYFNYKGYNNDNVDVMTILIK